ncbi:hypothetical protein ACH5RR_037484 [Cinchona calisaya]|uniref:Uncharacterized protein n=1 Tax=Cinchona calisaya TaxID=153742 RepID=A0ABD2YB39_9GENT
MVDYYVNVDAHMNAVDNVDLPLVVEIAHVTIEATQVDDNSVGPRNSAALSHPAKSCAKSKKLIKIGRRQKGRAIFDESEEASIKEVMRLNMHMLRLSQNKSP